MAARLKASHRPTLTRPRRRSPRALRSKTDKTKVKFKFSLRRARLDL